MKDIDKQDLDEQIEHHQEMLRVLRRRLRVLERKEAEYGIAVPAEVATEILSLNERIARHEAELTRLLSIAAEGDVPLVEVEYRAALAQAWEPGKPTVAGAAHLELVRVRSGIKPERAELLEREVRAALAEEAIRTIDKRLLRTDGYSSFLYNYKDQEYTIQTNDVRFFNLRGFFEGYEADFRALGRAIRLDISKALALFLDRIPIEIPEIIEVTKGHPFDRILDWPDASAELPEHLRSGQPSPFSLYDRHFRGDLLALNNLEPEDEDYHLFTTFLSRLDAAIKDRQGVRVTEEVDI